MGLFRRRRPRRTPRLVGTLLMETTWRCNAACAFCYNHYADATGARTPRREPSTRRSRKILEAAVLGSGCRQVSFTGGESTLRDDLFDLVAQARLLGAAASVLTNGSLIDEVYARDLARVGCSLVQLTFCGAEAEAHDAICGEGSFARTLRAAEALRSGGLELGLTFVLTRQNLEAAARFPAFAAELGQGEFLLNRFNPGGRVAGDADPLALLPTLAELRQTLAEVDEAAARARVTPFAAVPIMPCLVSFTDYPHLTFAAGCAAGTRDAYYTVDPWGDVRFCNHTPTVLGNLLEQPFEELVRSEALARFRRTRPPFCRPCPGWSICRGGCRAAAEQLTSRWDVEDPLLGACLERGEVAVPDDVET